MKAERAVLALEHFQYAIADESIFALCELLCGGSRQQHSELDQIPTGGAA
jgi:hypothetical protein